MGTQTEHHHFVAEDDDDRPASTPASLRSDSATTKPSATSTSELEPSPSTQSKRRLVTSSSSGEVSSSHLSINFSLYSPCCGRLETRVMRIGLAQDPNPWTHYPY